jgi:hypothetical protein
MREDLQNTERLEGIDEKLMRSGRELITTWLRGFSESEFTFEETFPDEGLILGEYSKFLYEWVEDNAVMITVSDDEERSIAYSIENRGKYRIRVINLDTEIVDDKMRNDLFGDEKAAERLELIRSDFIRKLPEMMDYFTFVLRDAETKGIQVLNVDQWERLQEIGEI